jgi:hypothetical protein
MRHESLPLPAATGRSYTSVADQDASGRLETQAIANPLFGSEHMTDERKYRDDEVKEIFDLAVTSDELDRIAVPDEDGLTLEELQEVGLEVGVDPSRVAEAALVLDSRRDVLTRRTSLGLPISVGRVIELPRSVTDHEWDILVSALRETFGSRGKVSSNGGIREWTHGTLHAFLEPTETGHRLRLQTRKIGASFSTRVGATGLAVGLSLITVLLTTGQSPVFMELALISSILIGGGALGPNVLRLPRWARKREGQMEDIASRVRALIGEEQNLEKTGFTQPPSFSPPRTPPGGP